MTPLAVIWWVTVAGVSAGWLLVLEGVLPCL